MVISKHAKCCEIPVKNIRGVARAQVQRVISEICRKILNEKSKISFKNCSIKLFLRDSITRESSLYMIPHSNPHSKQTIDILWISIKI